MKLKKEKCPFWLPQVEFLGHVISEEGLRPSASKVKVIKEAPESSSPSEFKSFIHLALSIIIPQCSNYSSSTLQITEEF